VVRSALEQGDRRPPHRSEELWRQGQGAPRSSFLRRRSPTTSGGMLRFGGFDRLAERLQNFAPHLRARQPAYPLGSLWAFVARWLSATATGQTRSEDLGPQTPGRRTAPGNGIERHRGQQASHQVTTGQLGHLRRIEGPSGGRRVGPSSQPGHPRCRAASRAGGHSESRGHRGLEARAPTRPLQKFQPSGFELSSVLRFTVAVLCGPEVHQHLGHPGQDQEPPPGLHHSRDPEALAVHLRDGPPREVVEAEAACPDLPPQSSASRSGGGNQHRLSEAQGHGGGPEQSELASGSGCQDGGPAQEQAPEGGEMTAGMGIGVTLVETETSQPLAALDPGIEPGLADRPRPGLRASPSDLGPAPVEATSHGELGKVLQQPIPETKEAQQKQFLVAGNDQRQVDHDDSAGNTRTCSTCSRSR